MLTSIADKEIFGETEMWLKGLNNIACEAEKSV